MQCKDIPEQPVLDFIAKVQRGETYWYPTEGQRRFYGDKVPYGSATWYEGFENSVLNAMPKGTPEKLGLAKMKSMVRKGLVDGCACGCRGDFTVAETRSPKPHTE